VRSGKEAKKLKNKVVKKRWSFSTSKSLYSLL
jgi:hypothetical protein